MLSVVVNNNKQSIKQEKLMSLYYSQSVLQQVIIQLRALSFLTQSKSDFFRLFSKINLTFDNKKLSIQNLSDILEQLIKFKLLLPNLDCAPEIRQQITNLALSNENPYLNTHLSIIKDEHLMKYELTSLKTSNVTAVHIAIHTNEVDFFNDKIKNFVHCGFIICNINRAFYAYNIDLAWVNTKEPVIQALLCYVKLQLFFANVKNLPPDLMIWVDFWQKSNLISILKSNLYFYSKLL